MYIQRLFYITAISLLLSSCLTSPFSSKDKGYELNGSVAGKKSNPDEKIVVIGDTTGYSQHMPLSSKGSRTKMDHDLTSYSYYLEKDGDRIKLDFLYRGSSDPKWAHILNVNNQWFVINIKRNASEIEIFQFKYSDDYDGYYKKHYIDVHNTDALAGLYISENSNVIIWQDINVGFHEYNIHQKSITRQYYNPSMKEMSLLLKIPVRSSKYEDKTFYQVLNSPKSKSNNKDPHIIIKDTSIDFLYSASNSEHYLDRWAVALNPKATKDLLEYLANDKSYYVASEARKRLATDSYFETDE